MKTKRKPGIELLQCFFFIAAAAGLILGAAERLPRRNIIDVLAGLAVLLTQPPCDRNLVNRMTQDNRRIETREDVFVVDSSHTRPAMGFL